MAHLRAEDGELVLHLGAMEKAEGFHGDIRAPGTGLPDVIAVGTRRGDFGRDFAAVHGKGPAVVVDLTGAEYGRFVVSADDAAAMASSIREAAGVS